MQNFKFTTDGKKVVVVGKLNSQESIVQEVFITESGSEIPSGENFVVKSLHDTLVESWKEARIKKIEQEYEQKVKEFDDKISRLNKILKDKQRHIEAHIKSIGAHLEESSPESFNMILGVLSGKIDYYALSKWSSFEIGRLSESTHLSSEYGVRMVSIFGHKNGNMQARINRYCDGSGDDADIYFFETMQSAIDYVRVKINSKKEISHHDIETASKYGFEIDEKKLSEYYSSVEDSIKKQIKSNEENIVKLEEQLSLIKVQNPA